MGDSSGVDGCGRDDNPRVTLRDDSGLLSGDCAAVIFNNLQLNSRTLKIAKNDNYAHLSCLPGRQYLADTLVIGTVFQTGTFACGIPRAECPRLRTLRVVLPSRQARLITIRRKFHRLYGYIVIITFNSIQEKHFLTVFLYSLCLQVESISNCYCYH